MISENLRVPFIINNINNIRKILNKKHDKKIMIGAVFKQIYNLVEDLNLAYLSYLIDCKTDLIDYYIFSKLSDAIIARKLGIKKNILVIYSITPSETILASEYDIMVECSSIDWLNEALVNLNNKKLKVHVWFDSGLSREGIINENSLFELLNEIKKYNNIKLSGLATKFNPDTSGNRIKAHDLIKMQIDERIKYCDKLYGKQKNKFNKIIKYAKLNNYINNDTIIHASCSNEVVGEYVEAWYDMVRCGTAILDSVFNNFKIKLKITNIKIIPKGFCMGYYCLDGHASHDMMVVYVLNIPIPNAIYSYTYKNKKKILQPINSGNPFGLIIDDIDDTIKVGDFIDVSINVKT